MTITDSRNKAGTLTLDELSFATQTTNVTLSPKTDEAGDPIETLSGDTITAEDETTWSLDVEAVQDFDDLAGFVNFCFDNANELVAYSWKPNPDAPTFSGMCRIRPVAIGGDVNKRLTTPASFPTTAKPTRTPDPA
jgi:hypothetical protein